MPIPPPGSRPLVAFLTLLAALLLPAAAGAAALSGTVSAQGQPLAGAMVTVFDEAKLLRDGVYTDAKGRYAINVEYGGQLTVRARLAFYMDASEEIKLARDGRAVRDFKLEKHSVAAELSESLPASAHLSALPWQSANSRAAFISQCNYCHQVGNTLTRTPRSESAWQDTVVRMEGYFAMLTNQEARDITKVLHAGFDGKPVTSAELAQWQPALATARVREWVAGDAMSFIHDADVGFDDKLYGADEGHDLIWLLDRKSGQIEQFKEPDIPDLPTGGVFSGSVNLKYVKLGYQYLVNHFLTLLLVPVMAATALELARLGPGELLSLWRSLELDLIHILCSAFLVVFVGTVYVMSRPRPVYLVDYACYKPPASCRVPFATFMEHTRLISDDDKSVRFQTRILERSGLGEDTCLPPANHYIPPNPSMEASRAEAQLVIFSAIDDLVRRTGLKPKDIDILVVNCSLFSPTPSLSAMIINKYKLRSNIRSFNLSGMGCSAGLISIDLARDMLQVCVN